MLPLSQAIEQYLEMCKYERNLSGYVRSVHQISQPKFCAAHHIVPDLLQSAYNVYTSGCREVLRDIVVLELLFSTGLRISELCAAVKRHLSAEQWRAKTPHQRERAKRAYTSNYHTGTASSRADTAKGRRMPGGLCSYGR